MDRSAIEQLQMHGQDLPGLLQHWADKKADHPALIDAVHQMMGNASVEGIRGALEAMLGRADSTPTLATIDVPTLVVVGAEDVLTPVHEAVILHDAIRGSRLEVIKHAGHVSNLERPAAFNHVLSEFLAALDYA